MSSTSGTLPIRRPESCTPPGAVRLHLSDLRQLGLDSAVAVRRQLVTQAIVGDVDTIVRDKVGLVLWRDNKRGAGVRHGTQRRHVAPREPLRWTVNCLVCHTAEIDGVAYFGAGTKTFDDKWLGDALKRLTSDQWRRHARPRFARCGDRRRCATAS